MKDRNTEIYRVTLLGSVVNIILVMIKFAAGIIGASAAMIADAVHSLSDLITDIIVIVFVRISSKPADSDHHYGHGKYETLATLLVGGALLAVGIMLLEGGVEKIISAINGETLPTPGIAALLAALASVLLKEAVYQVTARVGRRVKSEAVIANAWHHRSDAISSIGAAMGIGGAMLLGQQWAVLDPIAAIIVSFLVVWTAIQLLAGAVGQLLEKSLPKDVEDEIARIVAEDSSLKEMHHLRTRSIGNTYSIEMHIRMNGGITLNEAHHHSMLLERRLRERYGQETIISLHIEPLKVNGRYTADYTGGEAEK